MSVSDKLNRYYELLAMQDAIRLHYDELREKIVPQEIKDKLAEIDAEALTAINSAVEGALALKEEIIAEVKIMGASVKGEFMQAVYAKGRTSWDSKALEGYSAAHPEILAFRKEGEPSISIRGLK